MVCLLLQTYDDGVITTLGRSFPKIAGVTSWMQGNHVFCNKFILSLQNALVNDEVN